MLTVINQKRVVAYGLVLFIFLLTWLSFQQLSPPDVNGQVQDFTHFSALRAYEKLKIIAREPHAGGTPAHRSVHEFLVEYCKGRGLQTQVQEATGMSLVNNRVIAGAARNIIARLKGETNDHSVLVLAHYDSQPNTPGAADDGSGVAAMLETIDILTTESKLTNDVIFLFTDLEEAGLLGAEAFAHNPELMKNVGVVFNFEARGNSGASLTFETTENNGWIIREFAKAVPRPIANALAYEVYRRMTNYTDFTMFKGKNLSGLNSAFIDGYSYYHSPADTPENLDLRSLQHQGDHMLGMIRHFGNLDLNNTKANDAIYFNLSGRWLLIYSIDWDVPLIILTLILYVVLVSIGLRNKKISIAHYLMGFGLYLLSMLLVFFFVFAFQKIVLVLYPHYSSFYDSNFYNANTYVPGIAGMSLLAFTVVFTFALKRYRLESLVTGALLMLIIVMIALKIVIGTAAYLIYVPLLPALVVLILRMRSPLGKEMNALRTALYHVIMLMLPFVLWVPLLFTLFLAFSFSVPYAPAVVAALSFPLLLPTAKLIMQENKFAITGIAGLMILISLTAGHFSSAYTSREPLQSELMYALDIDSQQGFWISTQQHLDEWNGQYLTGNVKSSFDEFFPGANFLVWKTKTAVVPVSPSTLEILTDSLIHDYRYFHIRLLADSHTVAVDVSLPETAVMVQVNERNVTRDASRANRLNFYAPAGNPLDIVFIIPPAAADASIRLIERRMGLPPSLLEGDRPPSVVPAPGTISNTTQIKQTFILDH